jgi:hypothetical protein
VRALLDKPVQLEDLEAALRRAMAPRRVPSGE